ncbi:MAG: hypothetical protein ACLQK8_13420 [Streptosporangiaceae bacterium]
MFAYAIPPRPVALVQPGAARQAGPARRGGRARRPVAGPAAAPGAGGWREGRTAAA